MAPAAKVRDFCDAGSSDEVDFGDSDAKMTENALPIGQTLCHASDSAERERSRSRGRNKVQPTSSHTPLISLFLEKLKGEGLVPRQRKSFSSSSIRLSIAVSCASGWYRKALANQTPAVI